MLTHKILNRDPENEVLKAFRLFGDDVTCKISFTKVQLISDVDDDGSVTAGSEVSFKLFTHKILNWDPKDEILKAFRLLGDDVTGKICAA